MEKRHWLWYLEEKNRYSSIVQEMDTQLRPQFEELLGKKLNWERVWLCIEDSDYWKKFQEAKDSIVFENVQLVFRASRIYASLRFYPITTDPFILRGYEINPGNFKVDLKILDDSMKMDFPGPDDPFVRTRFDIDVFFPVFIDIDFFTDRIYLYFDLEDEGELEKLEKSFFDFVEFWNDTDVIQSGRFPEQKVIHFSTEVGGHVFPGYQIQSDLLADEIDFWRHLILYLSEEIKGIKSITLGTK